MATHGASPPAVDAVVRLARDVARLPHFPIEPWLQRLEERDATDIQTGPSVLKLVETDKIPGDVLPRARDTWLAILPFQDLAKKVPTDTKKELLHNRRAFVSLLTALATSDAPSPFRWETAAMHCGETVGPPSANNAFWIDLLRALSPESARDTANELPRRLITMSRHRRPRFLLCVTHDVTSTDFPELLDEFLKGDANATKRMLKDLTATGVSSTTSGDQAVAVEVGLSFAKGKITHTFLTKLLDIIDRDLKTNSDGVAQLRVVALRFGPECSFQAKAIELLGQRRVPSSIKHVSLGSLVDVKPASLRTGLNGLLSAESGLSRFSTTTSHGFKAVASGLRNGDTCVKALDLAFEPTIENAIWLAFGIFHVDSRSSVSQLQLRLPRIQPSKKANEMLTGEWLESFKRVLNSHTADQDLADIDGDSESQEEDSERLRRFVTIRAGTTVKSDLYAGAKMLCKVEDTTEEFELIASVDNSFAVVVSGRGVGWIPAASVLSARVSPSRLSRSPHLTNRKVKTLVVHSMTTPCDKRAGAHDTTAYRSHVDSLVELLSVVGEPLVSLHLPLLNLQTEHLAQILNFCPNLTELNISGHLMLSIAPLVDVYASGNCKIETLSVTQRDTGQLPGNPTLEMAEILRGPGGPTLRRLAIPMLPVNWDTDLQISNEQAAPTEAVLSFYQLINTMGTLEYVQLPGSGEYINGLGPFWRSLGRGDLVQVESRPPVDVSAHPFYGAQMPLRSKFAFLSCLSATDGLIARSRLDASALAQVFRFSADAIPRRVLIDVPLALERCNCCFLGPAVEKPDELACRAW